VLLLTIYWVEGVNVAWFQRIVFCAVVIGLLGGCLENASLSPAAQVGALAFADPSLSASGTVSCATCHAAATSHSGAVARGFELGGPNANTPGLRNSQTLRYLAHNTAFYVDEEDTPTGGFFWDGRANSLAQQAEGPLLGALEMANASKSDVVAKIAKASWVGQFKLAFGADVLSNPDNAFDKLTFALQQFQLEDKQFNAFSSKYDAVLQGKAKLSLAEARGLALFENPDKGNCAACHPSTKGQDGKPPLFTDFTYDNLGVPRNARIPANADPSYFDLGLCKTAVLASREEFCGAFKVPTLRNVALRKAFFHNGHFDSLRDVVAFYVQRDTHPERWYPLAANGQVQKFNDLPLQYHANVNTSEAPYNRTQGQNPALTEAEIDDVVTFLQTLNDGWFKPKQSNKLVDFHKMP
jgi:cytochrome c peroxidase